MTGFDKFCSYLAILFGILLLILGSFGLFFGSRAHFTLPPFLGVFPAFVGWGIYKSVRLAWTVDTPHN